MTSTSLNVETPIDSIPSVFTDLRRSFESGKTKSIAWRKQQIEQIYKMCAEQKELFASAANADFHRPATETIVFDCGCIQNECIHILNHIDEWANDEKRSDALAFVTLDKYVHPEPLGIVLVIGAWNYPFLVTLTPLIGAIAAGNCVILKPSEIAPRSAEMMAKAVERYLDPSCVRVVLGGPEQTQTLLKGDIDKIFYTGSTAVGKIVMRAAAEKMIPVTLECGGKNPVYVADDADMAICAKRIAWGKAINCGQTCLAPDYILCSKATEERLVPEIAKAWREFYSDNPLNSDSYCHIVNRRHFERVKRLIDSSKVVYGGQTDANSNYIAPTILTNVNEKDLIMQEEIFGPLLPFISVNNQTEAIQFINRRDKPLALYVFTKNKHLAKTVIDGTSAGSTCVSDVVFQIAPLSLPFGGVGASGMGAYHGKYSFDTFSHHRTVVYAPNWCERLVSNRNPPYTPKKTAFLAQMVKINRRWFRWPRINGFLFWFFAAFSMAMFTRILIRGIKQNRWEF